MTAAPPTAERTAAADASAAVKSTRSWSKDVAAVELAGGSSSKNTKRRKMRKKTGPKDVSTNVRKGKTEEEFEVEIDEVIDKPLILLRLHH